MEEGSKSRFLLGGFLLGLLIAFLVGLGREIMRDENFQRRAIENHAAQYDPQTGKFTWNDEMGTGKERGGR